ncbi:hypothetical protein [Legionella sainthelensi]|uniref:hypothetical protein n=1 Tax=Legionella sainthelensi TaxID=28087 RepID=UPI001359951D|nr:hypothetical protein [Legionella sainthelensi]
MENINKNGFIIIVVSAVLEVAGQGYLYRGELEDFYFDREGGLERLILRNASRRKIENDKTAPENAAIENRFYPIDGTYFVLKYSQITNLNVQFLELDPESERVNDKKESVILKRIKAIRNYLCSKT